MNQPTTLNDILLIGCVVIVGILLFAFSGLILAHLQDKLSRSCKPEKPEVENGHPIGEPKPFVEQLKK